MPPTLLNVAILYNRSNPFGLATDAQVLEELLRASKAPIGQIHHIDPREPPRHVDLQFHLEVPVYCNVPWASHNILLVNPEHYEAVAYDAYLHAFSAVICRDPSWTGAAAAAIRRCVKWCLPAAKRFSLADGAAKRTESQKALGFLALVGGSTNKAAALANILPNWQVGSPKLRIYTSRADLAKQLEEARVADAPVEIICAELSADDVLRLQKLYSGHLIVSKAEGFGYAAAEADAAGAFAIMSDIPIFRSLYGGQANCRFIDESGGGLADAWQAFSRAEAGASAGAAAADAAAAAVADFSTLLTDLLALPRNRPTGNVHLPPILQQADCPPITVVTLTYNRRNFIDLACLNLLLTDYPRDKIEWLVVEDSDDDEKAASDKIIGFASKNPDIQVSYIPLAGRTSIGEKRNKAVERAQHDIILFMDDDDVYPVTSFRRRVAWLIAGSPLRSSSSGASHAAVAATMLPMYHLRTGQSAVNVPPMNLPLGQRISEATLTFRKSFWQERPFSDVNIAEGENWLTGREAAVMEIPPQQIIVALTHGDNISSRKIPADARVGCFWGWDEAMVRFLHGLVGVKVEADAGATGKH